jgi:hypothetical protein
MAVVKGWGGSTVILEGRMLGAVACLEHEESVVSEAASNP